MPRIFDNIEQKLLDALAQTLALSKRADFCVGYFNLRGWKQIDSFIEKWSGGEGNCCRLLVGMHQSPQDEVRKIFSLIASNDSIDNQKAIKLKNQLAEEFHRQLTYGIPTNEDEIGLRKLASQLKAKKVVAKLFLRYPLHAKLYLLFRPDPVNPTTGFLGSSNLTLAGLSKQGELNIDVLDHDACNKLADWFNEKWDDRFCIDISEDLIKIIENSWAREAPIPPYHIYIKMAYHLSEEAQKGLLEFRIPSDFKNELFEFQKAAVKMAAKYLNNRNGVVIGDVVGLGKTLMASALARVFEDDYGLETLIICPKNLIKMWKDYRDKYRMRAKVLSISQVMNSLPELRRYRIVIIDESHNLINREGKRYRAIQEYIQENESKCILLSATPYNKSYLDLSSQLLLFVSEDKDIGIRPERLLRDIGETEFIRRHQCPVRSIAAFEKSEYADDWRELMRLYLIRRTRSFVMDNYAITDESNNRKFLTFQDGTRSYFPSRIPKTVKFKIDESDPDDQYGRLFTEEIVDIINGLNLPRYGLGNYITATPHEPPTQLDAKTIENLSRAGKRLMGFCRTNLFKRLESSGYAFIQSIERHILRNFIYLYAIENNEDIPIGTQNPEMLDPTTYDEDADAANLTASLFENDVSEDEDEVAETLPLYDAETLKKKAAEIYESYKTQYKRRFKWLSSSHFVADLKKDLEKDIESLICILKKNGDWKPEKDLKLQALHKMISKDHPNEKILIFSQFADTVRYLEENLSEFGITKIAGATGASSDPTALAWQFSPRSNEKTDIYKPEDELRVLIATDVLSEGQNLQDCYIVVNYDLPWAIIRLTQRAGRIDRIGQASENVFCYSFLPADGVEEIIRLRARVKLRLKENAEVIGTDEAFFEDDKDNTAIVDLYNEKTGVLDVDYDGEVDLASYAYQIWKNAITADPSIKKKIENMPDVVFSTKPINETQNLPEGVLLYMRTANDNDSLAWIDKEGNIVTESQFAILKAAECLPNTPALPRLENHHQLVSEGVKAIIEEYNSSPGGQLGRPSGARFRTYTRLKNYTEDIKGTLLHSEALEKAISDIYKYPLRQSAIDTLNRQLRSGISNEDLAQLVLALREDDRLCIIHNEEQESEPRIICSLGLSITPGEK